jgi:hypothetical protein
VGLRGRFGSSLLVCAALAVLTLCAAPSAGAFVLWTDSANNSIGRANDLGGGVQDSFIDDLVGVCGLATGNSNIYWGNNRLGTIGTATLTGADVNPSLISGGNGTCGVSLFNQLAWANGGNSTIGIGNTNGTLVDQSWASSPDVITPRGTASYFDGFHELIFYVNVDGSIWLTYGDAQAATRLLPPNTVNGPAGIAAGPGGIYWINSDAGTIGHANLDGSGVETLVSGIFGAQCGIALGISNIYWTNSSSGTIGQADLDGSNATNNFIDLGPGDFPCWIAQVPDTPLSSVAPSSLGFGAVLVGGGPTGAQNVTVTNSLSTTVQLQVFGTQLLGAGASQFSIVSDGCTGQFLDPGSSCSVSVDFSPTSLGGKSANLLIETSDPNQPNGELSVPLSGSGTDPDESIVPASIPFGHQLVGTGGPVQSVVLTNEAGASAPDVVGQAALTGPDASQFQIVTDGCSNTSVAIGASCEISLHFMPTSEGAASASLSIPSDDPTSPATVALSGTGTAPDEAVSPTELDFGEQGTGTPSATQSVTVANSADGTGPLVLGSVALAGSDPASYDLVFDACSGQSLSPGDTCKVGVRFAPSAGGQRNATLLIPSNGSASPQQVELSGSGVTGPSNSFSLNKPKFLKRGRALLPVNLPGAGQLTLSGKGVRSRTAAASGAGTIKLLVASTGKARRRLAAKGKTRVHFAVTFTPAGGSPSTITKSMKLVERPGHG